ncbi:hypothetical protein [Nonlabens antarcticus]|uniref:hypothetical protein n=1 Tax=Nonlabens antarcticus TaxID=392714 RepID=UPI0018915279|nr:hypothetical protein [Nonlabens antarcticus]
MSQVNLQNLQSRISLLFAFLVLLIIMSCNTDDTIEVQDENVVIENSLQLIQFKDVPREIVGEITNIRENLNEKSSSLNQFGEIDRNATVIRINTTQDDVSHTLLLNNRGTNGKSTGNASADIYFDNLYITTHEGTVTDKHIIRYSR